MKEIRQHTQEAALVCVCVQKYVSDLRPGISVSDKVRGLKWFKAGESPPRVCLSGRACVCLRVGVGVRCLAALVCLCLLSALSPR